MSSLVVLNEDCRERKIEDWERKREEGEKEGENRQGKQVGDTTILL